MKSSAKLSPDRKYRYWLLRVWDESKPILAVICANPSKADETVNDPTVRKIIGFGTRLGFGGILIVNVAAFRATRPQDCYNALEPIGAENTVEYLHAYFLEHKVERIVAAWGNVGARFDTHCKAIKSQIPNLWCWGTNDNGSPRHPLMLPYDTAMEKLG